MITLNQARGLTAAHSSGLLTATGTETVYDTTVAVTYSIDGKMYVKATVADGVTPTTDVNTSAAFTALQPDEGCIFVWGLLAAGTVVVAQGPVATIDGVTDEFKDPAAPQFPFIPDTMCPFAYQILQTTGASSAWTFGAGNWDATGVTDIIVNVSTLPSRPPRDTTA